MNEAYLTHVGKAEDLVIDMVKKILLMIDNLGKWKIGLVFMREREKYSTVK
jgi:hypothetical protein